MKEVRGQRSELRGQDEMELLREARELRRRVDVLIAAVAHLQVRHEATDVERRRQKAEIIIDYVAQRFGLSRETVLGRARPDHIAICRHVGLALARQILCWSSSEAGLFIGRDHGAVLNSYKQAAARRETDPKIGALYKALELELREIFQTNGTAKEPTASVASRPSPLRHYRHD